MRGTQWLKWPPLDDLFNRPHALVWLTFLFDGRGRRRLLVGNGEGRFSWVNPHPHLFLWTTKSVMFLSEIRSQIPCVLMSGPPGTHISIIASKDEREKDGKRGDERRMEEKENLQSSTNSSLNDKLNGDCSAKWPNLLSVSLDRLVQTGQKEQLTDTPVTQASGVILSTSIQS